MASNQRRRKYEEIKEETYKFIKSKETLIDSLKLVRRSLEGVIDTTDMFLLLPVLLLFRC